MYICNTQACPLAVVVLDARCRVTFKWMSRITPNTGSSSSSNGGNDRRHQYMNENDGHSSNTNSSSINHANHNTAPAFDIDKVNEAICLNTLTYLVRN
jgi:hypothetical protein